MSVKTKVLFGLTRSLVNGGVALSHGSFSPLSSQLFKTAVEGDPSGKFALTLAAFGDIKPVLGAVVHLYEQPRVPSTQYAPEPGPTHEHKYIGSFNIAPGDLSAVATSYVESGLPINDGGAKYKIKWQDGNGGSATLAAGWALTVNTQTFGTV